MSQSRARIVSRYNKYNDVTTENTQNESVHVRVTTPTKSSRNHRSRKQKMRIYSFEDKRGISLDGRQARSLYNVLRKHFDDVDSFGF